MAPLTIDVQAQSGVPGTFQNWTYQGVFGANNDYQHYFVDVNGDGRADWIQVSRTVNLGYVALSNGDGTFTPWITNGNPNAGAVNNYEHYFVDVNGDGKADWIQVHRTSNNGWVGLSNGDGTFAFWTSYSTTFGANNDHQHYFVDVNGDGRADRIQVSRTANLGYVALSNGDGTFTAWITSGNTNVGAVNYHEHYFADVNGDGKVDWIQVARNLNDGWVGLSNGDGTFTFWTSHSTAYGAHNNYEHYFVDVNGDGRADEIQIARTTNNGYVGLSTDSYNGLVTSITSGLTAKLSIAYLPLSNSSIYTKGSGSVYPAVDLQVPLYVVSSVQSPNGIGSGYTTTNYQYGSLKAESGTGRGLLGFGWVQATQVETGITTRTDYRQDWPYVGLPSQVKKTITGGGGPGNQFNLVTNTFACLNPANGSVCAVAAGNRYFPNLSQSVESSWDLNGAVLPVVTTVNTFDSYGNALTVAVSTPDGYSKTTTNTYTNDTANWYLGRLTRSTVQSATP